MPVQPLYPATDLPGVRFYRVDNNGSVALNSWTTFISRRSHGVVHIPPDVLALERRGLLWRLSPAKPVRYNHLLGPSQ
jgi:hypothetical protein